MGKVFETIDEKMTNWVNRQKMFFVSTAPLSADGLVNCSPKGMNTFRILGPNRVAYLDLTGSGVETISHLQENGRIVIMFCAFEGPANIVRFHGHGQVHFNGEDSFNELLEHFEPIPGMRSIIDIDVQRIADSCGYAVPFYDFKAERDALTQWSEKKGEAGVIEYQQDRNRSSLDGLPGVPPLEK